MVTLTQCALSLVCGPAVPALSLRCVVVLLRTGITGPIRNGAAALAARLTLLWLTAVTAIGALCALSLLLLFHAWNWISTHSAAPTEGQPLFQLYCSGRRWKCSALWLAGCSMEAP